MPTVYDTAYGTHKQHSERIAPIFSYIRPLTRKRDGTAEQNMPTVYNTAYGTHKQPSERIAPIFSYIRPLTRKRDGTDI